MKTSSIIYIILFSIALAGVVYNLVMINTQVINDIKIANNSDQKLRLVAKANEVVSVVSKYYYQMRNLADRASSVFHKEERLHSLLERFVKKERYIKAIVLASDNKPIYSFPKLSYSKLLSIAGSYVSSKKFNNTLTVNLPSAEFEDILPVNFFIFNKFIYNKEGKNLNINIIAELNIMKILREGNNSSSSNKSSLWLLNGDDLVVSASKKFKNRDEATLYYDELNTNNSFVRFSTSFKCFDNNFELVKFCDKKKLYSNIYPSGLILFFALMHLALIYFIILCIGGIIAYYYVIARLNVRISNLKIEIDDIGKNKSVNDLGDTDYFQNICKTAENLKNLNRIEK